MADPREYSQSQDSANEASQDVEEIAEAADQRGDEALGR